jgi:hypothetical protein
VAGGGVDLAGQREVGVAGTAVIMPVWIEGRMSLVSSGTGV